MPIPSMSFAETREMGWARFGRRGSSARVYRISGLGHVTRADVGSKRQEGKIIVECGKGYLWLVKMLGLSTSLHMVRS